MAASLGMTHGKMLCKLQSQVAFGCFDFPSTVGRDTDSRQLETMIPRALGWKELGGVFGSPVESEM